MGNDDKKEPTGESKKPPPDNDWAKTESIRKGWDPKNPVGKPTGKDG